MKLLERIEKLAEAICSNCSGTGSVAEHSPKCTGDCRDCPQQARCDECWATGITPYKIEAIDLTTLRDQARELVEFLRGELDYHNGFSDISIIHSSAYEELNKVLEFITDSKGGE